jgi:hypothetical protein
MRKLEIQYKDIMRIAIQLRRRKNMEKNIEGCIEKLVVSKEKDARKPYLQKLSIKKPDPFYFLEILPIFCCK